MTRVLFFILLLLPVGLYGQDRKYAVETNPADTNRFLYEYSMRYIGSSTSIDVNYRYVLEHLVDLLNENPDWTVLVRGHVCCGPSERISNKRAKKVYDWLISSGIAPNRVTYKGFSDTMPLAFPEKTEEDEMINRRVDFVIRKQ